jgi:hypothetical protein
MIRTAPGAGCIGYDVVAMNLPAASDPGVPDPAGSGTSPAPAPGIEPGRTCPLSYRYPPSVFTRPAEFAADVLYAVGGLYGNELALDSVEALASLEAQPPVIVFNGDFHWFDIDPDRFLSIDVRVARHRALRGNVETELAGDDEAAGCGCAYPESVGAAEVERSNRILDRLRATAKPFPSVRARLARLPMHAVAQVGGRRVAIVHGDLGSLAGWSLAEDSLRDPLHCAAIAREADAASIDVIACSHTCLPVAQALVAGSGRRLLVMNNGAAGMPNFRGDHRGLITRIARTPAPVATRYGACLVDAASGDPLFVDALDLDWPAASWQQRFLANWPAGSPAHQSYWTRICDGPAWTVRDADRLG